MSVATLAAAATHRQERAFRPKAAACPRREVAAAERHCRRPLATAPALGIELLSAFATTIDGDHAQVLRSLVEVRARNAV